MLIYGIDPGYTGAITLYWPQTGDIEVHDMPTLKNAKGKTILNMCSDLVSSLVHCRWLWPRQRHQCTWLLQRLGNVTLV